MTPDVFRARARSERKRARVALRREKTAHLAADYKMKAEESDRLADLVEEHQRREGLWPLPE